MRENKKNLFYFCSQDFTFDLKIIYAGIVQDFDHQPDNHPFNRFALDYLIDGEGTFKINEKTYQLKKGDLFFVPPNVPYEETNSKSNPYAYYSVSFYGSECATLFAKAGLTVDNPVLHLNDARLEEKMREIVEFLSINNYVSLMNANISLYQIFLLLSDLKEENHEVINDFLHRYVTLAQEYMHERYHTNITTEELAKYLHLNRSYLCRIFKKITSLTIKEYLVVYRINKAMSLLIHSDLSVAKIAENVGFNDYTTFYRSFKTLVGMKPNVYRNAFHPKPTKETILSKRKSYSLRPTTSTVNKSKKRKTDTSPNQKP